MEGSGLQLETVWAIAPSSIPDRGFRSGALVVGLMDCSGARRPGAEVPRDSLDLRLVLRLDN
jgi:hypothetical protein